MLENVTDYLVKIGGPIAVISTGMFFLLRHYVAERIKADFAKQLEELRQKNQTAVEVLRGTILKDLESLRSSLDLSGVATRILIERRIQYYEEYLKAYYALDDAVHDLRVTFEHAKEPFRQQALIEVQQRFYSAKEHFDSWWARSAAFVRPQVFAAVHELWRSAFTAAQAAQQMDFQTYDARIREAAPIKLTLRRRFVTIYFRYRRLAHLTMSSAKTPNQ